MVFILIPDFGSTILTNPQVQNLTLRCGEIAFKSYFTRTRGVFVPSLINITYIVRRSAIKANTTILRTFSLARQGAVQQLTHGESNYHIVP